MPVLVADLYTPLGVSVWILYLIPLLLTLRGPNAEVPLIGAALITLAIALTSYTDHRLIDTPVALTNRLFGLVGIWAVAWLTRRLMLTRNAAILESRLRGVQAELLRELQGELSLRELGARTLRVIGQAVDAPAAAFYASHDEQTYQLVASRGVDADTVPADVRRGDGLIGHAVESGTSC